MSSATETGEDGAGHLAAAAPLAAVPERKPVSVTVLDSGESFRSCGDASVLENLRRTGKRGIPVGCRAGGCGVCKVQVVSGAYEKIRPMSQEFVSEDDAAQDRVLACCIRPLSNLELRVIGKLQKAFRQPCQTRLARGDGEA